MDTTPFAAEAWRRGPRMNAKGREQKWGARVSWTGSKDAISNPTIAAKPKTKAGFAARMGSHALVNKASSTRPVLS